jgi:tetratricopeptide (TPR) repeat protein
MFSAAGQVTIHYAQKFENNNNLKQALKFYETGSELVPENGLVNQRIASVNRFLFYETGDYKYLQNMYENFSSSISKSRANGIYYINNAKAYSEFTGTLNYNEIKFYTAKALALDPYNISLYIDACMIYDNLKKSLTKQKKYITARTGLTVEPLSIRLAEFCSMNNDELEDEFSRRIENLKKFRNARNYYIREINSETLDPVEENYYRILFQMSDN